MREWFYFLNTPQKRSTVFRHWQTDHPLPITHYFLATNARMIIWVRMPHKTANAIQAITTDHPLPITHHILATNARMIFSHEYPNWLGVMIARMGNACGILGGFGCHECANVFLATNARMILLFKYSPKKVNGIQALTNRSPITHHPSLFSHECANDF